LDSAAAIILINTQLDFAQTVILHGYMAYLVVHSRAVVSCSSLFDLNFSAISGTSGSSGFGSVSREQIDSSTFEMVSAGDHWSFRMSKQMPPFELMLQ